MEPARHLGPEERVMGCTLTQVDLNADIAGTRVRTMAADLLSFCAGAGRR